MKKVTIIGATSPLGIDLTTHLAASGYDVIASYRDPKRVPASLHAIAEIVPLELTADTKYKVFSGGTIVWLAHLDQGRFNKREVSTNLDVFANFLEQAVSAGIDKIIFISSGGSVYGEAEELPIREDHPIAPLSSYGKAKAAMERLLVEKVRGSGRATAILRPGNIYGFTDPNHDVKGIVAAYIEALAAGGTFTLIHEGRTIRDFIHTDDVVRAVEAAISSGSRDIVWNVATGVGHSTREVIEMVNAAAGRSLADVRNVENFASDVERNILAIERITAESTWVPQITLEGGIIRTVAEKLPATGSQ